VTAPARLERDEITRLSYLMLGLWGFLLYALGPALPALKRELDVSRAVVSLHTTIVALGAVAVGVSGARIVRRVGRRRAFWAAGVGLSAGAVGLAIGRSLALTLPAAAVLGFAGALVVVLIQATLADRHGSLGTAAIVEANALATALGAVAPLTVALAILAGSSWRAVFLLAGLLAVPALAVAYRCAVFPAAPRLDDAESALPHVYWMYWFSLLTFVAVEFCVVFWATDYLETVRGLEPAVAAGLTSLFLVGMTVGRVVGGPFARRIPAVQMLGVALAVTAAGFVLFWAPAWAPAAVAGLGVTGLGVALLYPLTLSLALAASGGRTDAASARAAFASGVAIALAPFALAALADAAGLRVAYAVVPVLLAVGSGALVVARRTDILRRPAASRASPGRAPAAGGPVPRSRDA
jgi:MFS family permease